MEASEFAAWIALGLSVLQLAFLPVILGKLFFSTHEQILVTPEQHAKTREALGLEQFDTPKGPDLDAYYEDKQAKAKADEITRRLFPDGEEEDEMFS